MGRDSVVSIGLLRESLRARRKSGRPGAGPLPAGALALMAHNVNLSGLSHRSGKAGPAAAQTPTDTIASGRANYRKRDHHFD
jgi:hypothetical protein